MGTWNPNASDGSNQGQWQPNGNQRNLQNPLVMILYPNDFSLGEWGLQV